MILLYLFYKFSLKFFLPYCFHNTGAKLHFFFSHPLQQASPWLGQCEIVEKFCSNLFLNVYENDKNEAPKYAKKCA